MSTFNEPNSNLILESEEKKLKKDGKMTKAEIDTHNKEELYEKGRGPASVDDVIVESDDDPLMSVLKPADLEQIQQYTEEEDRAQQEKEDRARRAYREWQSQQVDWIALVDKGYTPEGKRVYEKRIYRYHDLNEDQKEEIQRWMRKVEDFETRKNYLQFSAIRNKENLEEWVTMNYGEKIDNAIKHLRNLRMEYYFGETNTGIISKMRSNDIRDLIDAAVHRENKLPLSRKRASSGITLKDAGSAEQKKK